MQPETLFKIRVLNDLKKLRNTWAVKVQQMSIRGTPDILACINGLFVALELKKDGKSKTTRIQDYELGKIRKAGGVALLAYPGNWEETVGLLRRMADYEPPW